MKIPPPKEYEAPEPLGPDSEMPFGKHRGERMDAVPDDYWEWLLDNGLEPGPVMDYLEAYTDLL